MTGLVNCTPWNDGEAIDNGPMAESLMETGQVKHLREDGVRPDKRNIDWLVCDMVEKPIKVANLMIDWAVNGFVKEPIFNLKLPMKKRFDAVYQCLDLIHEELTKYNIKYELQAKHLYHDRGNNGSYSNYKSTAKRL